MGTSPLTTTGPRLSGDGGQLQGAGQQHLGVQANRLYWLGRYVERVERTLGLSSAIYDRLLDDSSGFDVHELCGRLAIPDAYAGPDDFIGRYMFDPADPNSVISNLGRAFDNAIVMRDLLKSDTLAYIQLALNTMQAGARSPSPMLEVQETLDYLYAFWGALDDYMDDVRSRYTVRAGGSVERVDLALRLRFTDEKMLGEVARLESRIERAQVPFDAEALGRVVARARDCTWVGHVPEMLADVNGCVLV